MSSTDRTLEDFENYLFNYESHVSQICHPKYGKLFTLDPLESRSSPSTPIRPMKSNNIKVVSALTIVTLEMRDLNHDFRFTILPNLPFLHVYEVSELLKYLKIAYDLVSYTKKILHNVINQLGGLYSSLSLASHIHFQTLYCGLGSLLSSAVYMDYAIYHSQLSQRITDIISALGTKKDDPQSIELTFLLKEIKSLLCSKGIFKKLIQQDFGDSFNKAFGNSFFSHIKNALEVLTCPRKFLEASCLLRLLQGIFPTRIERRVMNKYWDLASKHFPVIHLIHESIWIPEKFMEGLVDTKRANIIQNSRNQILATAPDDLKAFPSEVLSWSLDMLAFTNKTYEEESLKNTLFNGIQLAQKIQFKTSIVLNLHKTYGLPLAKSLAIKLCQSLQLIKFIQGVYQEHMSPLNEFLCSYGRKLMLSGQIEVERVMQSYHSANPMLSNVLHIAQDALSGPPTPERLIKARLSITLAGSLPERIIKDIEILYFGSIFRDLDFISTFTNQLEDATNCSFFSAHSELLNPYLEHLLAELNWEGMKYVFDILDDCLKAVQVPSLRFAYIREFRDTLQINFLEPLSREIETDVRLQVHVHLDLDEKSPFKYPLKDFSRVFDSSHPLFDQIIQLRSYMESYMEKIFYTQTAVAPHDWKTYSEMKGLVRHLYDMDINEDHLPAKILEQGEDILQVNQDMNAFVMSYNYNINSQRFLQIRSKNKHLNAFGIFQISNSIRTHGLGILNTTVNVAYKLLRIKIKSFSQFLFEDIIKSGLKRAFKAFDELRSSCDYMFPYERAEAFLGTLLKSSPSKLDTFRNLVTQIGNTMGLVRTIRSGGLHFISNAIGFIPDLKSLPSFESLVSQESSSNSSQKAALKLDEVIEDLTKKLGDKNEFFQLLISIFSKHVLDERQCHLRNFYLILPTLTINFIEHNIQLKENIVRNNKDEGSFTDDGFPMGVAYLLTLLQQWPQFESLNWFESVRVHFKQEELSVQRDKVSSSSDRKLSQTISLTLQRLCAYKREFELLYFNLSSSKSFFLEENQSDE